MAVHIGVSMVAGGKIAVRMPVTHTQTWRHMHVHSLTYADIHTRTLMGVEVTHVYTS